MQSTSLFQAGNCNFERECWIGRNPGPNMESHHSKSIRTGCLEHASDVRNRSRAASALQSLQSKRASGDAVCRKKLHLSRSDLNHFSVYASLDWFTNVTPIWHRIFPLRLILPSPSANTRFTLSAASETGQNLHPDVPLRAPQPACATTIHLRLVQPLFLLRVRGSLSGLLTKIAEAGTDRKRWTKKSDTKNK